MDNEIIYEVSSMADLWPSFTIAVKKDTIVACSDRNSVTIGSSFKSMRKYWNQFDGDNAYIIKDIQHEP